MPQHKHIVRGNVEDGFKSSDIVLEGSYRCGGQEHFYLETHAVLVIPKEDNEMEVHCSTQNPTETQHYVAKALGIPDSRVTCRVKRLGG